jgi:dihydrofolate reductase
MGKVVVDMSMSLDGFVRASNATPEQPLGEGGERLHEWGFGGGDERGREVAERSFSELGAGICGRNTYDSLPWWGADGPTGEKRLQVFVVTHEAPAESPEGGVYTFVTDGIESSAPGLAEEISHLLYSDERGVCRVYEMSIGDGRWELWREGEPFAQRFRATISDNGETIEGRWEKAPEGRTWETDFDLTYRKAT